MKVITSYICEVCGQSYTEQESAMACESTPPPKKFPVGLMFCDSFSGPKLAFAIARQWNREGSHYAPVTFWACRDTGVGDSLGKETCGNELAFNPSAFDRRWLKRPPVIRLREWLESQGITPTVWSNGAPVPISEFAAALTPAPEGNS